MPIEIEDITPADSVRPEARDPKPLELARKFHSAYERLAPSFGYETRTDTRAFDPETPNGKLMTAVCADLLADLFPANGRPPLPDPEAKPGFFFADMLWVSVTLLVKETYDDPDKPASVEMHQMMASTNMPDFDSLLGKMPPDFGAVLENPKEYVTQVLANTLAERTRDSFAKTLPPNKTVMGFEAMAHGDLVIVPRGGEQAIAVMRADTGEFIQGTAEEAFRGR